jgi:hypothetical protein
MKQNLSIALSMRVIIFVPVLHVAHVSLSIQGNFPSFGHADKDTFLE